MSVKKYNVKVNGVVYEVEVEELSQGVTSAFKASAPPATAVVSAAPVSSAAAPAQASAAASSSPGFSVLAPLNGTILSLAVKLGDSVKKGDLLCILEAMKMENEVFAPKSGIISEINIEKSSNVGAGDVLFTIS